MKCHRCGEDKLSEEFPYYAPSENCDHALLHCLKVSTFFSCVHDQYIVTIGLP